MKKIIYIAITFAVCRFLGLGYIWLGFAPAFLAMLFFSFSKSVIWEIPLAVLSCNVLELAFSDDMRLLIHILILCGTIAVSAVSPKRLPLFFLIAVFGLFFENIYGVSAIWATVWFGIHTILSYFTTKHADLQEYKL